MKKIYYLSVNNENLYAEFLRFDNEFIKRNELNQLSSDEIREVIMVTIDTPNVKDLFLPFKKKILYILEYKEAKSKKQIFYSYLLSLFFDLIFEWDANLCKNSKSFLPFFPTRVGLIHEKYKVKELKGINFFLENNFHKNKNLLISSVVSNKKVLDWHKLRLKMIFELKSLIPELDIFGRGFNTIPEKSDALIKYKYHIVSENCDSGPSENLWDRLLCQCVVFYSGNLDLVHPQLRAAIIQINIYDIFGSYEIITSELEKFSVFYSLTSDDWANIKKTIRDYYSFEKIFKKQIQTYL